MLTLVFFYKKKNRCCLIHKLKPQTLFPRALSLANPFSLTSILRHRRLLVTTLHFATCHCHLLVTISRYVSPSTPLNLQLLQELVFITAVARLRYVLLLFSFWALRYNPLRYVAACFLILSTHWYQKVWILFITHSKIQSVEVCGRECCSLRWLSNFHA